jgi:hypothetical protein
VPLLVPDDAKEVAGREIGGFPLEDLAVEMLRLPQPARLVKLDGLLKLLGGIRLFQYFLGLGNRMAIMGIHHSHQKIKLV